MTDSAITVEGLGKKFRIGETVRHDMLRESLMELVKTPYRFLRRRLSSAYREQRTKERELWALKDVSFEVERGSVVGIIGRNGAGKSTLLKILSRITEPTEGRAIVRGRVGSLLEVGTGFHQELTGRENIYLSGAILGMTKKEIDDSFEEMVEFAGVKRFIDTPVKRYSSGMRVRLGFAVAAHLRPEILIVDEVLAVGDVEFQKRCIGKMGELAGGGRTVIFVSHNMDAILRLTRRTLVLDRGTIHFDGPSTQAVSLYLEGGRSKDSDAVYRATARKALPTVTLVEVKTTNPHGVQEHRGPLTIVLEVTTPFAIDGARVAVQFVDSQGRNALIVWMFDVDQPLLRRPGTTRLCCRIPKLRLYKGSYRLRVHLSERPGGRQFECIEGICPFEVVMGRLDRGAPWYSGITAYLEEYEWHIDSIGPNETL